MTPPINEPRACSPVWDRFSNRSPMSGSTAARAEVFTSARRSVNSMAVERTSLPAAPALESQAPVSGLPSFAIPDSPFAILNSPFAIRGHARRSRIVVAPPRPRCPARRPAVSLVESALAVVLVGSILVVALNAVGGAVTGRKSTADHAIAQHLAMALMTEILAQSYADPDQSPIFGIESGETGALGNRTAFDDVDDYHNWTESPPQRKSGEIYTDRTGWRRTVRVQYVANTNLTLLAGSDQGFKRITVIVALNNEVKATVIAIRSGAAQAIIKEPVLPILEQPLELLDILTL